MHHPRKYFRCPAVCATVLVLSVCLMSLAADASTRRVVVKLRAPIADAFEADVVANAMSLSRGSAANPDVRSFLSTYAVRRLTPVYPALLASKQRSQRSDRQMAAAVQQRFARRAGRLRGSFMPPDLSRTYVLELDPGQDLDTVLRRLQADPRVEFAEPNRKFSANSVPNDPFFSSSGTWGQPYDDLWGVKKVNAPAAWDSGTGQGIVVAVVDSGIDYNHPDIGANVWTNAAEIPGNGVDDDGDGYIDDVHGWNFAHDGNDPLDDHGHGTHVAGTIAAVGNNRIGVIGVAPGAQVMAVKILDTTGSCDESVCAQGIVYAADRGADVINLSWGGDGQSHAIADAVDYAYSLGAVLVAAAGNNGADATGFSPGALWNVITVAATDHSDARASFSNWGSRIDVAAPGVDILSLQAAGTTLGQTVGEGYTRLDGTSMAAPHVTGLAALLLAAHPDYSNEDVRQALRVSADHPGAAGIDQYFGYGRVNATAALSVPGVLEAKINAPVDGLLAVSPVTISGVARGVGFAAYTLAYGLSPTDPAFATIQTGATATSGALGVFDPASANCVYCTVRLTAYNTAGQAFVDQIQVATGDAHITSPAAGDPLAANAYKPGMTIPIMGTAVKAAFRTYQIQWAPGIGPATGWRVDGLTLASGGNSPVTNGLLATWATPRVTTAGYYTLSLTVYGTSSSDSTITAETIVYLEPDLMSDNWPQGLSGAPAQDEGVVPAMNADGSTRLVLAQADYNSTGGALWTLPLNGPARQTMLPGFGNWGQPAVASLDDGPADDVVAGDWTTTEIFHSDGTTFSTIDPSPSAYLYAAQPQIARLGSNSEWDIVSVGQDPPRGIAYVFAWRPDGSSASGNFPIQLEDLNGLGAGYMVIRCIVGDVDGDGKNEIVVAAGRSERTYELKLFGSDGSPRPWNAPIVSGQHRAMAAADLDYNGRLETIVASTAGDRLFVHMLQPDGTERNGWPVSMPVSITHDHQVFIAVADLNRDGSEEIVVCDEGHIYVLKGDGTSFSKAWPMLVDNSDSAFGPVVLGDIDGDGRPEIVTTHWDLFDVSLRAFRSDGTIARSWKLTGRNGLYPTVNAGITIGDFNQDGITDIAAAYGTGSGFAVSGVVTVLSTGAPFNPAVNDWPMIYQNPRNSAVLEPLQPSLISVANGASLRTGPVAAGELVVLSGTGLGVQAGASVASGQTGATSLAGSEVLFDKVPAPLQYTQSNYIYALVPQSVVGRRNTKVEVLAGVGTSLPLTLPVAAAAPGIFTRNDLGAGQCAALNEDGTLNAAASPAAMNSVVSLFVTGVTVTSPLVREDSNGPTGRAGRDDGATVTIGGQPAPVVAQTALEAGVMRLDVRVPLGIAGGNAVPVVVQSGGASSQPGVSLAVRP